MRIDELMGFIQTYKISLSSLKESKSITLKASLNEKNEYESFDLIKMEKLVFLWKIIKDAMIFQNKLFQK